MRALSKQESCVLALLVNGHTNREIGARLKITEATVKAHVSGLLAKVGAANRAELAARAVSYGLALPAHRPGDTVL